MSEIFEINIDEVGKRGIPRRVRPIAEPFC